MVVSLRTEKSVLAPSASVVSISKKGSSRRAAATALLAGDPAAGDPAADPGDTLPTVRVTSRQKAVVEYVLRADPPTMISSGMLPQIELGEYPRYDSE